jgi:hypothetical protein
VATHKHVRKAKHELRNSSASSAATEQAQLAERR